MSKAKPEPDTDTNTHITPQPSTPIKHAGSNCLIGDGRGRKDDGKEEMIDEKRRV